MGGSGSGKPKGELLVLDGTELVDGKLQKTDFFNFLKTDLSDYSHITMTPAQALKFKNSVVRMKHGTSAAIPMLCCGERCFNKLCAFHDEKNYPLSLQCLLEVRLVQSLTKSYMEDLNVDPDSPSELVLINKLVECDLIDYRANLGLSGAREEEDATLLLTTLIETDTGTNEMTKIHPLLDAKEKAHRQRMHILESMAATRREKYKKAAALKKSEDSDASTFLADLKEEFQNDTPVQEKSSLDKIKADAEKIAEDFTIDADWTSDE